ncbi:hypothetical protein BSR28_00995 [Boudabousia liubingyangii]|uniref:hypothetical protein n=1 Tax=Boudabousia liubingyangii TaxID=1921764 RepID=UPI00093AECFA|nr:hypothetical protein [Boudabousia liubingyangii]OKL48313.1 hypothetical protein BSR28_00995 [Boudabousia liubingyangii]
MISSRKIEQKAVNAVEEHLLPDEVIPNFQRNDKTPAFDGDIFVYDRECITIRGKIPVQIKGKTYTNKKHPKSFPLKRTDIQIYKNLGGVLFFAVFIDLSESKRDPQVFYSLLHGSRCERLLEARQGKSISVPLKRFPSEENQIRQLMEIAVEHLNHPKAISRSLLNKVEVRGFKLASMQDLSNPGEAIQLDSFKDDFTLSVIDSFGEEFLLSSASVTLAPAIEEYPFSVASGEVLYEDVYKKQKTSSSAKLILSRALAIDFVINPDKPRLSLRLSTDESIPFVTLKKAVEFIDALARTRELQFGEEGGLKVEGFDQAYTQKNSGMLQYCQELSSCCTSLGIDPNFLLLGDIKHMRSDFLKEMSLALEKRDRTFVNAEGEGRVAFPVGEKRIELFAGEINGVEGLYSLFQPDQLYFYAGPENCDSSTNKLMRATIYEIFDEKSLHSVLNNNLGHLVEHYESIGINSDTRDLANNMCLKLINLGDREVNYRPYYYRQAKKLLTWISEKFGEEDFTIINRIQLNRRERFLSDTEKNMLRDLRTSQSRGNGGESLLLNLLIAGLLENIDDFKYYHQKMSSEELEELMRYPIWTLFLSMPTIGGILKGETDEVLFFPLPQDERSLIERSEMEQSFK